MAGKMCGCKNAHIKQPVTLMLIQDQHTRATLNVKILGAAVLTKNRGRVLYPFVFIDYGDRALRVVTHNITARSSPTYLEDSDYSASKSNIHETVDMEWESLQKSSTVIFSKRDRSIQATVA